MIRIAASTYLNSAPLVRSFAEGAIGGYEFIGDAAPSRCAAMLRAGECEIALIPVIEYQRTEGLRLVPNVAVASKERVRSVLLASRVELREVRRVALDTSSRTSQALVRILLRRSWGVEPEFIERKPEAETGFANMLTGVDAALIIGDPAMRLAAEAGRMNIGIYDLAWEWRRMTGLPFVFAVWAVREGVEIDEAQVSRDFLRAKEEGVARLASIAASFVDELQLPLPSLLDYLARNVNYDLDEENLAGLRRYFGMAREEGLIPVSRELRFLASGEERLPVGWRVSEARVAGFGRGIE